MPPKGKKVAGKKGAASGSDSAGTAEPKSGLVINPWHGHGVITTSKTSCDIAVEQYTLHAYGTQILLETEFSLNRGNRYGLLGRNGSGKSTFLRSLNARDIDIPEHIDIYLLENEAPATDMTPIEYVVTEAEKEVLRLEERIAQLIGDGEEDCDEMNMLYDRLDQLEPSKFEEQAGKILYGLGFDKKMIAKCTKDMSGGWRMRVALARALFVKPALLLLDEPTNHLDLEACVWLENYLAKWNTCLVVTSHSQEFLNGVCNQILHLTPKKVFQTYTGNYDAFLKTKSEHETNQMKQFKKQQDDIAHIKKFINSAGTYANLVRQAQSKQKIIDKMEEKGLIEEVQEEAKFSFSFLSCEPLPPPVVSILDVAFAYSGKIEDYLYEKVSLGFNSDSRIALVGPNGAGKSTLLKLISRNLEPCEGEIKRHTHARFGFYNQHIHEVLDPEATPLDFMMRTFGEGKQEEQLWRGALGRFGVSGVLQGTAINKMSDGQRRRLMFCYLAYTKPNMLLLDEPTNHLDMETIDALAGAIKAFDGGMLLVSHDFRLIDQVAEEIWVCDDKTVSIWKGDIKSYKKHLENGMIAKGLIDA